MICKGASVHGTGRSIGHHGEILQGAFRGANGRIVHGLMTLPCARFKAQARFVPHASSMIETGGEGPALSKSRRAATLALNLLGQSGGGCLRLISNIPPQRGLGSSTADVVATLRAVADAHEQMLTEAELARLAVAAEGAADPVMFSRASGMLFAQREGDILEEFDGALPAMTVLSIDTDSPGVGIDTLARRIPRYSSREIDQFERLRVELRRGIEKQDLHAVATVAMASAYLNETYLPKPRLKDIASIGFRTGAIGFQVAHSGTMVGLIFDPRDSRLEARVRECADHCCMLGLGKTAALELGGSVLGNYIGS
jgi:uncharacterized protein involved in propanediol utilization